MNNLFPTYRIRQMGGGIYRNWWLVERRIWLKVWGFPVGWVWQRFDYFDDLKTAQNWVIYGGEE